MSEKIGYQKPSKEFFQYIENKISGFIKEEALMIGDNIFADIFGAKNFGIDTVWCNFKNKDISMEIKPTYIVVNYKELESILLNEDN